MTDAILLHFKHLLKVPGNMHSFTAMTESPLPVQYFFWIMQYVISTSVSSTTVSFTYNMNSRIFISVSGSFQECKTRAQYRNRPSSTFTAFTIRGNDTSISIIDNLSPNKFTEEKPDLY